jgi:MFS superfamily sulfate permease-like transporter
MFERFKRDKTAARERPAERGGVATADRETAGPATTAAPRTSADRERPRFGRGPGTDAETARVRARQREEFGGINWGSAFFGWLVAVGMAAILLGLLSAAGAAFGLGDVSEADAESNAETIGVVGGILLILVLGAAYYCGGYVSGRMSRFDGGRQGLAVWMIGLIVTIVLAVAGALFGAEYNVLEQLNLPRIPVEEGSLTTGAAIALVAVVLVTLIAAMGGGKAGERYHRKVDRAGYIA